MPEIAVVEKPAPTFAEFHKSFDQTTGSAAPADVEVTVADPADTGAPSAKTGESPTSEPAPATDPDKQEQGRFEKRVNEKQRRIDELTKQETELKQRVAALSEKTPPEKTEAKTTPAPASADFDGTDSKDPAPKFPDQNDPKYQSANAWEQYEQDKLNWAVDKAKWDLRKESRVQNHKAAVEQQSKALEAQQKVHKAALETFEARGSEYAEEHPEYVDRLETFKAQPISNETAAVIVNSENGPAILDHLMANPDELKRIEALPLAINRLDAIYELKYKLAHPTEEKPADPAPRKSKAPAAGTVLRGGGASTPTTVDNAPNFSSFKTAFDKSQGLR
jgi:hypothetical protein